MQGEHHVKMKTEIVVVILQASECQQAIRTLERSKQNIFSCCRRFKDSFDDGKQQRHLNRLKRDFTVSYSSQTENSYIGPHRVATHEQG